MWKITNIQDVNILLPNANFVLKPAGQEGDTKFWTGPEWQIKAWMKFTPEHSTKGGACVTIDIIGKVNELRIDELFKIIESVDKDTNSRNQARFEDLEKGLGKAITTIEGHENTLRAFQKKFETKADASLIPKEAPTALGIYNLSVDSEGNLLWERIKEPK